MQLIWGARFLDRILIVFIGMTIALLFAAMPTTLRADPQGPQIAGGKKVTVRAWRGNYRWMAGLLYKVTDDSLKYFCQGTLINRQWVLTAAHCVMEKEIEKIRVGVNSRDIKKASQRKIDRMVVHPRYRRNYDPDRHHYADDIALLRLAEPLPRSFPTVRLIDARDSDGLTEPRTGARIVGWGRTDFDDPRSRPDILRHAATRIRVNRYCRATYLTSDFTRRSICARGRLVSPTGICPGDSGGPLLVRSDDEWVQVGIVSGAKDCPQRAIPAIFTRISSFRAWIERAVQPEIEQIATGDSHTCALDRIGQVWCWGYNSSGQIGDGSTDNSDTPVRVESLPTVKAIATGEYHTCAITRTERAMCWGWNSWGQLGDGTTQDRLKPVPVSNLPRVTMVAGGWGQTCAITRRGRAKCWGESRDLTPSPLPNLPKVTAITTGTGFHTCAITRIGRTKCQGWNGHGQLGDGTTEDRLKPVPVLSLPRVIAVAAGYAHTCAITRRGRAKCWGWNKYGQLGDRTTQDRVKPITVSNLPSVMAIAAGDFHTCTITQQQRAMCWGRNDFGRLGDGTTRDRQTPIAVSNLPKVTAIAAGGVHTCAITRLGRAKCWGWNERGQLGNGTTQDRLKPDDVRFPIK